MSKKKIILIGASGVLGGFFSKELSKNNNIKLICSADNNLKNNFKNKNKKFNLDISNEIEIKKFFKNVRHKYGEFDCLINNAAFTSEGAIKEKKLNKKEYFEVNNWNKNINVNLTGTFLCIKYFLKYHGNNKRFQKIISTGSIYGSNSPDHSIYKNEDFFCSIGYSASKAGIIGLNKWLAKKFASQNFTFNMLSPAGVYNRHKQKFLIKYLKNIPLRKMANQRDIFGLLEFLIDDKSNYINGENIHVDGGFSA